MTEEERQSIIKKIDDDLKKSELCSFFANDKESIIYVDFLNACAHDNGDYNFSECPHGFYVYTGSFSLYNEKNSGAGKSISDLCKPVQVNDESDKTFSYNSYQCLLCGKKVHRSSDWMEFEGNRKHLVLRNKKLNPMIALTYYRKLYFSYLYEADSIESADELLMTKYYDDIFDVKKSLNKE